MEQLRLGSGVTEEEKATVELEELGTPIPTGMKEAKIKPFPTPGSVIDKVIDPQRKQMLKRLYPEYKRLCAYAHGSAQSWIAKTAFWDRSPLRKLHTDGERQTKYENEIVDPAFVFSFLPTIQSTCEVGTLYPSDVEIKKVAIEGWNVLSEMNLLGKVIWEMRGKTSLGIIGPRAPLLFSPEVRSRSGSRPEQRRDATIQPRRNGTPCHSRRTQGGDPLGVYSRAWPS